MQQDTISSQMEQAEITLAIVHIGMMLASWDAEAEILPLDIPEINQRIYEIFGIEMWNEPDVVVARNKIVAVIETLKGEETIN